MSTSSRIRSPYRDPMSHASCVCCDVLRAFLRHDVRCVLHGLHVRERRVLFLTSSCGLPYDLNITWFQLFVQQQQVNAHRNHDVRDVLRWQTKRQD